MARMDIPSRDLGLVYTGNAMGNADFTAVLNTGHW